MDQSLKDLMVEDLKLQYEKLYQEHLDVGGQSILDHMLAFQRVLRHYTTPQEFEEYMASLQEENTPDQPLEGYECEHVETKPKLVAWATDSRYGHEQGFKMQDCCKACGKLVIK